MQYICVYIYIYTYTIYLYIYIYTYTNMYPHTHTFSLMDPHFGHRFDWAMLSRHLGAQRLPLQRRAAAVRPAAYGLASAAFFEFPEGAVSILSMGFLHGIYIYI